MLFQQELVGNSRTARDQWDDVRAFRDAYNISERQYAALNREANLRVNEGTIPADVFQEFDNVTVTRFRSDDGDTYLNDLLGLSRSINIGKLTTKFRRASDAGQAKTDMTGQTGVQFDQTEFNYDGAIVPIHHAGFFRQWREWNAHQSEGFDALIDDQRETVATVRQHVADQFLDGHTDENGNLIVVDGKSWGGMRNDSRVAQIDLGAGGINFDFTDTTETYADIEAAAKQVRDVIWITNNYQKRS